jgi:hypothetical protein
MILCCTTTTLRILLIAIFILGCALGVHGISFSKDAALSQSTRTSQAVLGSKELAQDSLLDGALSSDTVKASKDTTTTKKSVPSEEIRIVIVAAVVVAAIWFIIYGRALGGLSGSR